MQNNYYLIRQLVPQLKDALTGFSLADCFSQNKDELILKFTSPSASEFIIIAHLSPQFTCLAFPENYSKARKNTAPIFKQLINRRVLELHGFENERAFVIHFENNYALLFKMFGQQANIILFENNTVLALFRTKLVNDKNIDLSNLNRPINQNKEEIMAVLPELQSIYPTLNRHARISLEAQIANLEPNLAYEKIQEYITELESPSAYYISSDNRSVKFSLLPSSNTVAAYPAPIEALTQFFRYYLKHSKFLTTKDKLLREIEHSAAKTRAYIKKTETKKAALGNRSSHSEIADLIMANLHLIKSNISSVELFNFYNNETVKVKLNPKMNAQKNAEKYYHKAKNVAIEIGKLSESISSKKLNLKALEQKIKVVTEATEISNLKEFLKKNEKAENAKTVPFKVFNIDGFTIWVGNNAKQNDTLTLKYAKKEDLFFHAKDVAGSHVILKQISGKSIPGTTLEKTAALAAYYSKRKTDSLCPVGYTLKKYVRKPKGSAPGLVLVEREKVLLVKPELPQ